MINIKYRFKTLWIRKSFQVKRRGLFLLIIVLSVLLRFTDSDYPFDIFKLFFWQYIRIRISDCSSGCTTFFYYFAINIHNIHLNVNETPYSYKITKLLPFLMINIKYRFKTLWIRKSFQVKRRGRKKKKGCV
jgi:hypothetical protein